MTHENVITETTFDYKKHYLDLYKKYSQFLKDFEIKEYIDFKNVTGLNNCQQCHYQISEPVKHRDAKTKIFKLFLNERYYLIETELKANKNLYVPGKGNRNYQNVPARCENESARALETAFMVEIARSRSRLRLALLRAFSKRMRASPLPPNT